MKSFEAFALLAIGAMVGTALTMAMLGMTGTSGLVLLPECGALYCMIQNATNAVDSQQTIN